MLTRLCLDSVAFFIEIEVLHVRPLQTGCFVCNLTPLSPIPTHCPAHTHIHGYIRFSSDLLGVDTWKMLCAVIAGLAPAAVQ